jgi:hypothetical protein
MDKRARYCLNNLGGHMADTDIPKVTPLEGKTTVDDKMVFEPERLSYQSADRLTDRIATAVKAAVKDKQVVIAGTTFLADLANLQAIKVVLEQLQRDYAALEELARSIREPTVTERAVVAPEPHVEATAVGIEPIGIGVSLALGLVSLFREDVEYRGIQTVVNPLAFELSLASKVKAAGAKKVFVPDFVALPYPQSGDNSLRAGMKAVQDAKAKVWKAAGPLIAELVRLDEELDRAARDKNQGRVDELSRNLSAMRQALDPITEPLGRADQQLTDLRAAWGKTDEATGLTMLARWLRAEGIQALNPVFLHAQVVSSGGYNRTSRSLLRTIFIGDGTIFMGGATARWALLENDGAVADGGIESAREWGRFPSSLETLPRDG